ncbi:MAG: hypothetical protein CBE33_02080 [Candidatus Pelagibacter sp. TMED273]|nr:MAG: hypothetical protein CBE33_02080 [Candidatus Pelagibacter sp. TMED273]|tara:strand:+ start:8263 stop:9120 length:858 start_codon:yes stop_codon:yes gene_type:complete
MKKLIYRKLTNYSLNKNNSFLRFSSYPYLSGDTLRNFAKYIYDETTKFDPKDVKENEIIFLKTDFIQEFFEEVEHNIKNKYFLITHNSDLEINKDNLPDIGENIIRWYAQNLNFVSNEKIKPIPIGIENFRYLRSGLIKNFKNNKNIEKNDTIFSGFNIETNKNERSKLLEISKNLDSIEVLEKSNLNEYLKTLSRNKFALCPSGQGLDTHRVWESLIFDTVPILLKNNFSYNFQKIGIPLLLLDSWDNLEDISKDQLNDIYRKIKGNQSLSKFCKFNYWIEINN